MPPGDSQFPEPLDDPAECQPDTQAVDYWLERSNRSFERLHAQANRNTMILLTAIHHRLPMPIEQFSPDQFEPFGPKPS